MLPFGYGGRGISITSILVILAILAIMGMGWDSFFSNVVKGLDKVKNGGIVQDVIEGKTSKDKLLTQGMQNITEARRDLNALAMNMTSEFTGTPLPQQGFAPYP